MCLLYSFSNIPCLIINYGNLWSVGHSYCIGKYIHVYIRGDIVVNLWYGMYDIYVFFVFFIKFYLDWLGLGSLQFSLPSQY